MSRGRVLHRFIGYERHGLANLGFRVVRLHSSLNRRERRLAPVDCCFWNWRRSFKHSKRRMEQLVRERHGR